MFEHIAYYYTNLARKYRTMGWNEKAQWALNEAAAYRSIDLRR